MINIYKESSDLIWQRAYKRLVGKLEKQEKSLILLSGGSVTVLYPLLADYIRFQKPNVALGQVDERFQPLYSEDQNGKAIANTGLFDAFEKGKSPVFLVSQEGVLERAALEYDTVLKKLFEEYPYKTAILGIGEDGHTAGFLPGYESEWNKDRLVVGYRNNGKYPMRISLTPKALRHIDYALVVAMGEGKRGVIKNLELRIMNYELNKFPAGILGQMKEVDVYTDVDLT